MLKYYTVADHTFGIELPEDSRIWGILGQYEPFASDSADAVFVLSLADSVPSDGFETVLDPQADGDEPLVRVLRRSGEWLFELSPHIGIPVCGRVWVSRDLRDVRLNIVSNVRSQVLFAVNNALMLAYALSTACRGTLEMHASMVSNSGKAFLFIAKSGTGKSTHSSLWMEHVPGTELMNDDNPVVRVFPDGRVIAYGSPWSGKTPCYKNVQAPVGAIVKIRRSKDNVITRLSLPEAFAQMYSSCSGLKADDAFSDGIYDTITSVVSSVPCYVLDCRPDRDAADVSSKELLGL